MVADKLWSVNYRIEDPSMTGRLAASRGGATGYNPASEQFRAKVTTASDIYTFHTILPIHTI